MGKCPKCKAKIDHLDNWTSGEAKYEATYDGSGINYDQIGDFEIDHKTNDFECPECQETLFKDEKKATAFLKGKKR